MSKAFIFNVTFLLLVVIGTGVLGRVCAISVAGVVECTGSVTLGTAFLDARVGGVGSDSDKSAPYFTGIWG